MPTFDLEEIDIGDLASTIEDGNTIPIIGYELLRLQVAPDKHLAILEFLAFEFLRITLTDQELVQLGFNVGDFRQPSTIVAPDQSYENINSIPIDLIKRIFRDRFRDSYTSIEIINSLYYQLLKYVNKKASGFKSRISKIIKHYRDSGVFPQLHEPLVYLSSIIHFNFYVNATIFQALQISLKDCRLEVQEELKNYGYNPVKIYDDFVIVKPRSYKKLNNIILRPTVYNLFVNHERNMVLTESDYIELLYDLSSNENEQYTDFKYVLSNANLLFIGCNFRDWFLRFFLRFCSDSKDDFEEKTKKNFLIDDHEKDNNLVFFMTNSSIKTSSLKVEDFVKRLYNHFGNAKQTKVVHSNYVFISFNSADREIAKQISNQLNYYFSDAIIYSLLWEGEAVHGGFWYDEIHLRPGSDIEKEIGEAIRGCSVFLPIVTSNIQRNLKSYFWAEWDFAVKNPRLMTEGRIIPVKVGNYDSSMILEGCRINPSEGVREYIISDNKLLGFKIQNREIAESENPLRRDQIDQIIKKQFELRVK